MVQVCPFCKGQMSDDHLLDHHQEECFRCVACTRHVVLFTDFSEVVDHCQREHQVQLDRAVLASILPPRNLEIITCGLCNNHNEKMFVHEETALEHFATHSEFFVKNDRWRKFSRRICRICKESVNGIDIHLKKFHQMSQFAVQEDLEETCLKIEGKKSVSTCTTSIKQEDKENNLEGEYFERVQEVKVKIYSSSPLCEHEYLCKCNPSESPFNGNVVKFENIKQEMNDCENNITDSESISTPFHCESQTKMSTVPNFRSKCSQLTCRIKKQSSEVSYSLSISAGENDSSKEGLLKESDLLSITSPVICSTKEHLLKGSDSFSMLTPESKSSKICSSTVSDCTSISSLASCRSKKLPSKVSDSHLIPPSATSRSKKPSSKVSDSYSKSPLVTYSSKKLSSKVLDSHSTLPPATCIFKKQSSKVSDYYSTSPTVTCRPHKHLSTDSDSHSILPPAPYRYKKPPSTVSEDSNTISPAVTCSSKKRSSMISDSLSMWPPAFCNSKKQSLKVSNCFSKWSPETCRYKKQLSKVSDCDSKRSPETYRSKKQSLKVSDCDSKWFPKSCRSNKQYLATQIKPKNNNLFELDDENETKSNYRFQSKVNLDPRISMDKLKDNASQVSLLTNENNLKFHSTMKPSTEYETALVPLPNIGYTAKNSRGEEMIYWCIVCAAHQNVSFSFEYWVTHRSSLAHRRAYGQLLVRNKLEHFADASSSYREERNVFLCKTCQMLCNNRRDLHIHMREEHPATDDVIKPIDKNDHCFRCQLPLLIESAKEHGKSYSHRNITTVTLLCRVCGLPVFGDQIIKHNSDNHKDQMFRCMSRRCQSFVCGHIYLEKFMNHLRYKHRYYREPLPSYAYCLPTSLAQANCPDCSLFFVAGDLSVLRRHCQDFHNRQLADSDITYTCRVCMVNCESEQEVEGHRDEHKSGLVVVQHMKKETDSCPPFKRYYGKYKFSRMDSSSLKKRKFM